MSLAERLSAGVRVGGPDECWPWTGYTVGGYGRMEVSEKQVYAHRLAFELARGGHPCMRVPLPGHLHVLHRCDNPPCCNPEHLFLGNQPINMRDMLTKGRATGGSLRGVSNPASKLTPAQVADIRQRLARGESKSSLSREFGIARSTIQAIELRQVWKDVP